MDHDRVVASIIPDGYHVDHAAIRIARKLMGDRLFVITDAVTDTNTGYYHHKKVGNRYEAAGILSGSALTMFKALQSLVKETGIDLSSAFAMCSRFPARLIGWDGLGSIKKGAAGKLVIIDREINSLRLV